MKMFQWSGPFNVICGTPCIGKTTFASKYTNVIDLQSSPYKYSDYDKNFSEEKKGTWKNLNPNFLSDYMDSIKTFISLNALVLLPMYEDVRQELDRRNIKFAIAYSASSAKQDIIKRFQERGNNQEFIDRVMSKFDERNNKLIMDNHPKITVLSGEYLEDALERYIITSR